MKGVLLLQREQRFLKHAATFAKLLNFAPPPTEVTPVGSIVFRKLRTDIPIDYFGLMRQVPDPSKGSFSKFNRFSGAKYDGDRGMSGSYWGTLSGTSAECYYYNFVHGYDPNAGGPLRLMPSMEPIAVIGANSSLPYYAEEGAPELLPQAGNFDANLIMARTVRRIETLCLDYANPRFLEWQQRFTQKARAELDDLQFNDLIEAIYDPEFKSFSRLIANNGYVNGCEALTAKSVRAKEYSAPEFDPSDANNLVLFGHDGKSLSGMLVGTGMIEMRSDITGHRAELKSFSAYPSLVERSLVPADHE